LVADGDDISAGGLTISAADSIGTTNQILVLDLNTDSVGKRSFQSLAAEAGLITQGDNITAGGLSITVADSDPLTNIVLVLNQTTDSVGIRSFSELASDAGLIAQGDNVRAGGLTITEVDSDPNSTNLLVLDTTTDSVGIRSFASLAIEADIGADTLQTVTDRGDSTTGSITIAGLSMTQAESDGTTTSLLVLNELTDSVGIRSFANLVDDAGLGQDTLQSVTDRGFYD
jgi:lambda repressor-like predicted transcriptional regulator